MAWVPEQAEKLPEAPGPDAAYTVELAALSTFMAEKKTGSTS